MGAHTLTSDPVLSSKVSDLKSRFSSPPQESLPPRGPQRAAYENNEIISKFNRQASDASSRAPSHAGNGLSAVTHVTQDRLYTNQEMLDSQHTQGRSISECLCVCV